jgi:hypothetical protein
MRRMSVSMTIALCLANLVLLSGCLDITSTSQVNSNGSIVRTITFTGDSAEVYAGKFPVELDSSWSKNITKIQGQRNNFTLTATRTFLDADEMNSVLKGTFGRTLQYRFDLDRSFRWFFTVYRYRETNIPFDQFTTMPITDFVSGAEIEWLTKMMSPDGEKKELATRGDSLALERLLPRIQEAEWRNRFEAVFNAFLEGVRTINNPSLTPTMVGSFKDSLYRRSAKAIDKKNIDTLRIIFAGVLRNPAVDKAWQANAAGFEEIKRKVEFEQRTNSHKYVTNVAMPGIITGSNARKIEGNVATWEDFKDYAYHIEYTMWVESRQVNWWAVIIALAVVVSLMAGLILSVLRRRNHVQ